MLTVQSLNPDKRLAVTIAVFFAEDALSFWEAEFSEDIRPRKAIEAAKEWLANPCEETVAASRAASYASYASRAAYAATAHAAHAAANAAANAANAANAATAHAAHAANAAAAAKAAYAAAHAAANAAYAANANAAYAANANAANANRKLYTHNKLAQLLPHLFEYKIYAKTSFKDPEQVFDLLSKQNQQRFLFNLDCLR